MSDSGSGSYLTQSVKAVFKTFDFHSLCIEGRLTVGLRAGDPMLALLCERYDLNPIDDDGVVDVFKIDRALRRFVRESYQQQKVQVEKWDRSQFGLKQFEGESWE